MTLPTHAAIVVIVFVSRFRSARRDLWTMAWIVFAGVLLQAAVGGILVIFALHPNMVAFHYLVSLALVAVSAAFLVRMGQPRGARERAVPKGVAILVDLGGAETNSEMAIEMQPEERAGRIVVCNAPIVEGAVIAATEASGGASLDIVRRTAEELSPA